MSNDAFGDIFDKLGRVKSQLEFAGDSGETEIDEIRTNLVRVQADVVETQAQSQRELNNQISRLNTELHDFKSAIQEKVDKELGRMSKGFERFELDTLKALVRSTWKIASAVMLVLAIVGAVYWALLNRYFAAIDDNGKGIRDNGKELAALGQKVDGIESDVDRIPVDTLAKFEPSVEDIFARVSTARFKDFEQTVRQIVDDSTNKKFVEFEPKVQKIVEDENALSESRLTMSQEKTAATINDKIAELRVRIAKVDATAVSVAHFRERLADPELLSRGKWRYIASSDAISMYLKYHPEAFLMSVKYVEGLPEASFGIEGELQKGDVEVFVTSDPLKDEPSAELWVEIQLRTP